MCEIIVVKDEQAMSAMEQAYPNMSWLAQNASARDTGVSITKEALTALVQAGTRVLASMWKDENGATVCDFYTLGGAQ